MSVTDNKADWPLLRVVNEIMKPTGRWKPAVIRGYRVIVRRYERFRGGEQTAGEVTVRLLEKFKEQLLAEGVAAKAATEKASVIGSIVRQADPDLLPNRNFSEFSKAEEGDLLYIMENEYFPAKSKIASETTERQYKYTATRYSTFLGRRATLDDLTDQSLGKWMRQMRKDGLAMATINGYVTKLRAFWNWCAKKRMVEEFPTIEDFPEPMQIPKAYSEEEFRALIAAAKLMKGRVGDVPAGQWWYALHLVAFDTGERCSALLHLEWNHYDAGDATLAAPAEIRKGGRKPMLYRLKPATVATLATMRATASAKKIFFWPFDLGSFYHHYKKLLELAGLPYVPHKSGLQKVRRTFASHIEAAGGNSTQALSHTSRRVTEKSYIDPRIAKEPSHNERLFDL